MTGGKCKWNACSMGVGPFIQQSPEKNKEKEKVSSDHSTLVSRFQHTCTLLTLLERTSKANHYHKNESNIVYLVTAPPFQALKLHLWLKYNYNQLTFSLFINRKRRKQQNTNQTTNVLRFKSYNVAGASCSRSRSCCCTATAASTKRYRHLNLSRSSVSSGGVGGGVSCWCDDSGVLRRVFQYSASVWVMTFCAPPGLSSLKQQNRIK